MYFIFDLSASMTRFNGHDGRLDRSLECALLIMEAFKNFEHKFQYRIAGHSGDGADIVFVEEGKYPRNEKDMFMILTRMNQHAQYCLSGDHTLAAASSAIQKIKKGTEADDYFVLVLSDANLAQCKNAADEGVVDEVFQFFFKSFYYQIIYLQQQLQRV